MSQFNVAKARESGYSDDEIISHLAQSRKFDLGGAKKAGYSSQEILDHLSKQPDMQQFTPEGAPGIAPPSVDMQPSPTFTDRLYETTVGAAKHMGQAYAEADGPNPLVKAAQAFVVEPARGMAQRFTENPNQQTRLSARVADAVAGPIFDQIGQDVESGNLAGAAGSALGTAATAFIPLGASKAAQAGRAVRRAPSAAAELMEQSATRTTGERGAAASRLTEVTAERGIPTTVGERTGSPMMQSMERAAERVPGAAGVATDFFETRNAQVMEQGRKAARQVGKPAMTMAGEVDGVAAAEEVTNRIRGRASDLRESFGRKYDSVEKAIDRATTKKQASIDAEHARQVRAVERYNRAELAYTNNRRQLAYESGLNPDLQPPPLQKPIPKKPEPLKPAQIEMEPIRKNLEGLFKDITETMPETQRAASPGYQALKNIMEDEASTRGALSLDRDLGAIKRILRSESEGYAATPSGRLAKKMIQELDGAISTAVEEAGGPKAIADLRKARMGVREMHRTYEMLDRVLPPTNASPVALFERLTMRGDKHITDLQNLRRVAPQAVDNLAATWFEGALSKTTGQAGSMDVTAMAKAYKDMGPRTKQTLFREMKPELDEFMEIAPQLIKNVNKSGTASALMGGKALGVGGVLAGAAFGLGVLPESVAVAAAGTAGANAIARFLFRPGNPTKLRRAMAANPETTAGKLQWKRLNAAIDADPELALILQSGNSERPSATQNLLQTEPPQ
jgi:hypothetical protein